MSATALIQLLKAPQTVAQLSGEQWNVILVQGRKNQLLGQLAALFQRNGLLSTVPMQVVRHLQLELLTARRRGESAQWELSNLRREVDESLALTVLKGCAYVAAGDINHVGRSFSDIDLMVDRSLLRAIEGDLVSAGWKPSAVDDYDARYYREWMHEVPPMEHIRRHTVLDLHHAINPPVSDYYVDPALLTAARHELSPGIFVLAPLDRVIHCALHLIQEGETKKLLRDLYDLHLLVGQHCAPDHGVSVLLDRAQALGVRQLVASAVGASQQLFGERLPKPPVAWLQTCLVLAAKNAHAPKSVSGWIAGAALLIYSHWIKMPLSLLIPHGIRKGYKAIFSRTADKNKPPVV